NKIYDDYEIEIKTPFKYFEKIKKRENTEGEFLNNSMNFILQGVYSSRIYIKQANANSQWLLTRISEPLQAIGHYFYNTKNKQNEINYAYKMLIKNHAHDSIYGCSIDEVYDEIMIRYKKTDTVSKGVIKRTIRDLSDKNAPLCIINLSNFNYSGKVKIITEKHLPSWLHALKISEKKGFTDEKLYNINDIPVTEDITDIYEYIIDVKNINAFSLTQIKKENICNENYIKVSNSFIENKNIKIEIKNKKLIFTDKKRNEKYQDFISIKDRADIGDSYNFGALINDKELKADLSNFKIKEVNDKRAVLNLIYNIKIPQNSTKKGRNKKSYNHKINIDIILYNQAEYIEFKVNWENKSKNHIMQVCFKLKEKIYSTLNEDLFGITKRRFNPDYNIYKEIPAGKGKELKVNTSPMQRFMQSQNFGLFVKGNNEYEVYKNEIKLTILRSSGIISNAENPCRGTPAGPPLKTADLQCTGKNYANFAIAFINTENDLYRLAEEFYEPYVTLFSNHENKIFLKPETNNQLVYAVKTENNKLVARCYERQKEEIKNIVIKD
ncbi:MAG: hypothetical protein LUH11_03630, partial [Candidatus Gastranaerophilales bacterium]|nr:hypothetical protein [Candidatus Gastranaerophilales bacterium]